MKKDGYDKRNKRSRLTIYCCKKKDYFKKFKMDSNGLFQKSAKPLRRNTSRRCYICYLIR